MNTVRHTPNQNFHAEKNKKIYEYKFSEKTYTTNHNNNKLDHNSYRYSKAVLPNISTPNNNQQAYSPNDLWNKTALIQLKDITSYTQTYVKNRKKS